MSAIRFSSMLRVPSAKGERGQKPRESEGEGYAGGVAREWRVPLMDSGASGGLAGAGSARAAGGSILLGAAGVKAPDPVGGEGGP